MPSYREELISQIPAAHLLINLGYQYLTPAQALELRGGSYRQVVLTNILADWLRENNRFEYKGQSHPFSENAIAEALRRVTDILLADGLTVKQIAERLRVNPRTIRYYVGSLNAKFGTQSKEQSVGIGVLMGLCRLPS